METEITLKFVGTPSNKDIAARLRMQANVLEGMEPKTAASRKNTDTDVEVEEAKTALKSAKGKKAAPAAAEEEDFDLGGEEEAVEEKKITVKDMISAFKAYADANSREDAGKILKKYKVKSVHDIKPELYSKILAEIEV